MSEDRTAKAESGAGTDVLREVKGAVDDLLAHGATSVRLDRVRTALAAATDHDTWRVRVRGSREPQPLNRAAACPVHDGKPCECILAVYAKQAADRDLPEPGHSVSSRNSKASEDAEKLRCMAVMLRAQADHYGAGRWPGRNEGAVDHEVKCKHEEADLLERAADALARPLSETPVPEGRRVCITGGKLEGHEAVVVREAAPNSDIVRIRLTTETDYPEPWITTVDEKGRT